MDSDGIDIDTMDVDHLHRVSGDEVVEGAEQGPSASSSYVSGYHNSHEPGTRSICGSEGAWWDGSVDGEQEWGLTDGDSMSTSEGELSFGDRFSEANVHVRLELRGRLYHIRRRWGGAKKLAGGLISSANNFSLLLKFVTIVYHHL